MTTLMLDNFRWNAFIGKWVRSEPLCPTLQQQLHEQQTKEAMTKFKKGDRVKIHNPCGVRHGSTGVIDSVSMNGYIVAFDGGGDNLYFGESAIELIDQPLSTTPDKVLQAAKTSPQAKDALKALFPDVFKEEPLKSRLEPGTDVFSGVHVGLGSANWSKSKHEKGRYLFVDPLTTFTTMPNPNGEGTFIEFHKKP